jgi:hypothetical protein
MYEAIGFTNCDPYVSETLDDDGNRNFDSLWLFNETSTMEAELTEAADDQLDGAPLTGKLVRWATRSRDYDFVRATAESRLKLELWYSDSIFGDLSGSGQNCDRLRDLMVKHLLGQTGANGLEAATAAQAREEQ